MQRNVCLLFLLLPAVFKAGAPVPPVVEVPLASLGDAAGTDSAPFSHAIPAANLPEPNRYAVKIAALNANGVGAWSAMSEVAVYGEWFLENRRPAWDGCLQGKLPMQGKPALPRTLEVLRCSRFDRLSSVAPSVPRECLHRIPRQYAFPSH